MPSSCHNSPTKVVGDITKHHVCESCGQVYDEVNEKEWWEQMRHDEFHFIEDEHSCCIKPHHTMLFCRRLITEANRRRDQEWREKLDGMRRTVVGVYGDLNDEIWNSALDEAKKLFTEETRKEEV